MPAPLRSLERGGEDGLSAGHVFLGRDEGQAVVIDEVEAKIWPVCECRCDRTRTAAEVGDARSRRQWGQAREQELGALVDAPCRKQARITDPVAQRTGDCKAAQAAPLRQLTMESLAVGRPARGEHASMPAARHGVDGATK